MKFQEHSISGLYTIIPVIHQDERGGFHRSFCEEELTKHGINFEVKQGNISVNLKKHTLRGFHHQSEPTKESKILTCVIGSIYNVVLDLRRDSKTKKQWVAIEISSEKRESIHVPAGCSNAFLTMSDNTIVHYYMGDLFSPDTYRGIRYNDPRFGFEWPCEPAVISEKDLNYPNYQEDY